MASRIGIELSPAAWRIIELDPGKPWRRDKPAGRVVSFASLAPDEAGAAAKLAAFRGRRAAVVLWRVRSDHRQVTVTTGSYERMRAEARAALTDAGLSIGGTLSDISLISPRAPGMDRCAMMLASAPRAEVTAALAPLVAAGLNVRTVLTPAAALQSLARTRTPSGSPDAIEAYVALEELATCIAIVRDRVLLAARWFAWGYLDEQSEFRALRDKHDIAARLADELSTFFTTCRFDGAPLAQVLMCGGLPELRSMTVPLMERLDIEVETLDSLFAVDAARLPEPADQFCERAAEMRVAWAAAADRSPALDLFRHRRRRAAQIQLSRAAVLAGAAAGLGIGWLTQNQWRPVGIPGGRVARAVAPVAGGPVVPRLPPAPPGLQAKAVIPTPLVPPPVRQAQTTEPGVVARRTVPRSNAEPTRAATRNPAAERPAAPARPKEPPRPVEISLPSAPRRSVEETTAPFEASLGTILYGPDRALAIVDGRIVQSGDEVRGARVVEITANAVFLRDAQGQLRHLSVGTPSP